MFTALVVGHINKLSININKHLNNRWSFIVHNFFSGFFVQNVDNSYMAHRQTMEFSIRWTLHWSKLLYIGVLKMSKMKWWLMFRIYVIHLVTFWWTIFALPRVIVQIYSSNSSSFCYYYFLSVLLPISNLNDDVNRNDYPSHAMTVAGTCVSFVTTVPFTLCVFVVVYALPHAPHLTQTHQTIATGRQTAVAAAVGNKRSRWNERCWQPRRSRWPLLTAVVYCSICILWSRFTLCCRVCHLTIYYFYFFLSSSLLVDAFL